MPHRPALAVEQALHVARVAHIQSDSNPRLAVQRSVDRRKEHALAAHVPKRKHRGKDLGKRRRSLRPHRGFLVGGGVGRADQEVPKGTVLLATVKDVSNARSL